MKGPHSSDNFGEVFGYDSWGKVFGYDSWLLEKTFFGLSLSHMQFHVLELHVSPLCAFSKMCLLLASSTAQDVARVLPGTTDKQHTGVALSLVTRLWTRAQVRPRTSLVFLVVRRPVS